ncbi:MAG TPA: hypothetical protein VM934_18475 [Pyrinomonadaceae bacterium]|jgi:hypothetical protein|nr:hypothetical protein [Pyrinomonadaceae bacterium]
MKKFVFSFLLFCALSNVSAQAQINVKPDAAMRMIAAEGRAKESFVPKGWEIVSQTDGDLNNDKLIDAAITLGLTEDMKEMLDNSENSCESPPYIVVVLFAKAGGGYKRFAANGKLYPPACEDARPDLSIKNGVLIANHNWRDGWAMDTTFRFRFDPAENKLMLVGFDLEHYSRSNIYEGSKTSENYLTASRIIYAKSYKGRNSAFSEVKREKIKPLKVAFEDSFMNEGNRDEGDEIRPF